MLADIIVLCAEGDRLQREDRLVDALNRYCEALARLRELSGADTAALSLRARAAKSATAIMIDHQGDLDEIYTMLSEERAALTNLIDIPVGPERLHRHLTAFMAVVKTDDKTAAARAVASVLASLFGKVGPADVLQVHLAIIHNTLTKAEMIFERENDLDDARALAEIALSEIIALLPNATFNVASHPAIPLLTDVLDLLARLDGNEIGWFERAKIVCTLLPSAQTPWAFGLIQSADIAALMLGLGEPETA